MQIEKDIKIYKRKLTDTEIEKLILETRKFNDLIYVSKSSWTKHIDDTYVLEIDSQFAGVCSLWRGKEWVKLGPIIIFESFQGGGLARRLLKRVIVDCQDMNMFLSTTNPRIAKIIQSLNFYEGNPLNFIDVYSSSFLITLFEYITSFRMVCEFIRKLIMYKREKRRYFLKYSKSFLREKSKRILKKINTKSKSLLIRKKLTPFVFNSKKILMFQNLRDEPDLSKLIKKLESNGVDVAIANIKNFGYTLNSENFHDFEFFDTVVIPGRMFGKDGKRLGRGHGWYDRALNKVRKDAKRIGVCFEEQIFDMIPFDEMDEKVDFVITDKNIYETPENKKSKKHSS